MLYLDRRTIEGLGLTQRQVFEAVENGFRRKGSGDARTLVGGVGRDGAGAFHAKGGFYGGYCALKWFGYFPEGGGVAPPMILLNRRTDGIPLCVMEGGWITERRTAAISAVAATRLARPEAARIGFIACGRQAWSHLEALMPHFGLQHLLAYSRNPETSRAFAERAAALGLEAGSTGDPAEVLAQSDIVVSTAPIRPGAGVLDAELLPPGCFVTMPDLGHGWLRHSLDAFDLLVTDDLAQGGGASGFNTDREIAYDLADILPAMAPDARKALIFSGTGLADAACAALVYEHALERDMGRMLD